MKAIPKRSVSMPVFSKNLRRCQKCSNSLVGDEVCPCKDDLHPTKFRPRSSSNVSPMLIALYKDNETTDESKQRLCKSQSTKL